ncbi:class I SAM-dependent methyltransferase [Pseudoalteromonas sp.]|uniref:class I SAM-dependent methyltransferase n=1 Tax=Pseudoalteromonas sp. TaxID=53249 RepID=UPI003569A391
MLSKLVESFFYDKQNLADKLDKLEDRHRALETELNRISKENSELKASFSEAVSFNNLEIETLKAGMEEQRFSGHYDVWREKRVTAIIEHFGPQWFQGKKILELGCGYADISLMFATLGAEVSVCDARKEHIDIVISRYPWMKTYIADINKEWPFEEAYDLIIHMGVLYHLDDINYSLIKSLESADNLVLETEVSDSNDPSFLLKVEEDSKGYDQSITGVGSRPSPAYIESLIGKFQGNLERISDSRCNSYFHQYNWLPRNDNSWRHGLRGFWFFSKHKQSN